MDASKISTAAKECSALPAVKARVRLVVWERARNPHVIYAYLAEESGLAQKNGAPARQRPLWPVRLVEVNNAEFRRGMELECIHLGSGYYEFGGTWPPSIPPASQTR